MGSQSKIIFPTSSYISFNFLGLIIKYAIISEQICCQLCRRSSFGRTLLGGPGLRVSSLEGRDPGLEEERVFPIRLLARASRAKWFKARVRSLPFGGGFPVPGMQPWSPGCQLPLGLANRL